MCLSMQVAFHRTISYSILTELQLVVLLINKYYGNE